MCASQLNRNRVRWGINCMVVPIPSEEPMPRNWLSIFLNWFRSRVDYWIILVDIFGLKQLKVFSQGALFIFLQKKCKHSSHGDTIGPDSRSGVDQVQSRPRVRMFIVQTCGPIRIHWPYCIRIRKTDFNTLIWVGSLKMNTALEYSTRVVQEGDRRCKKSTPNDLAYLTPLRIPIMNPVYVY
jgi:hypothetical protein